MLRRFLHIVFLRIAAIWHFLRRTDILTFLLFLLLSALIWWGRTMSTPRDVEVSIPLRYSSIAEDIQFERPLPASLRVKVRDIGRQLRHFPTQDTQLEIDASSLISSRDGILHISAETLRNRLEDILPGSMLVLSMQPEQIDIPYQHQGYKTLPVHAHVAWTCAPQFQPIGDIIIEPSEVKAYGSRRQLTALKQIDTDTATLTNVRDTTTQTIALIAPDNIRLVPNHVQITCISEQYTEWSCTRTVEILGQPVGTVTHIFPTEVEVLAQVGMSHFSDVKESDFDVYCVFPDSATSALPVVVECSNAFVGTIRTNPGLVEYIVERTDL